VAETEIAALPAPHTSPSHKKTWIALVSAVVILAAGGWARLALQKSSTDAGSPGENHVMFTLHLETFVINLADADERAYLRVGIDLGLSHSLKDEAADGRASVALARDTILEVLARGKTEDLLTAQGKTKLKEDLLQSLQRRAPKLEVEAVYFTEFLIQR
jgi:flagellar protein FliL